MFFVIEQSIFLKKKDGLSDNEPWSIVNDLLTPIEVSISIQDITIMVERRDRWILKSLDVWECLWISRCGYKRIWVFLAKSASFKVPFFEGMQGSS